MRIAIVNDMLLAVEAIRRVLLVNNRHQIAWVARDGAEAVRRAAEDLPELILMDLIMPVMDGVEATRRIMAQSPCAILVVTATVDGNVSKVFDALGAGALDAVNTPILGGNPGESGAASLLYKIDQLGRLIGVDRSSTPAQPPQAAAKASPTKQLVAIGASAGGPAAVADVLRLLPANFQPALVLIQHVDEQFTAGLADWLGQQSALPVRLAKEGEEPIGGTVLVAARSDHLVFIKPGILGYTPVPRETAYRPSVDTFFHSVVQHWSGEVTGVLLTGMGRDGAAGLKALRDAGHHTIAQDQATSAVYGMPKAAATLGAAVEILPLGQIARALVRCTTHG